MARLSCAARAAGGERRRRRLEWYPVGRLVLWAAPDRHSRSSLAAIPNFGTDQESLQAALRKTYERILQDQSLIDILVVAVPPAAAVFSTIINLLNLWLAARIVKISGRLTRPWPDLSRLDVAAFRGGMAGRDDRRLVPARPHRHSVGRAGGQPAAWPLRSSALRSCTPSRAGWAAAPLCSAAYAATIVFGLAGPGDGDPGPRRNRLQHPRPHRRQARSAELPNLNNIHSDRWRYDHGSDPARTRRQARPDGRRRARQGRICAQLSPAQGQGAARHQGEPVALRDDEDRARGAQSRAERRGGKGRARSSTARTSRCCARRRKAASSTARFLRAISPRWSTENGFAITARRSRSTRRSRPSDCTRCRCRCIPRSR